MTRTRRKKNDSFPLLEIVQKALPLFLILTQNTSGQEIDINMIIGGSDASPGEFPFAVVLTGTNFGSSNSNWFCGGTLLALDAVLTSVSCLDEISLLDFQVYPSSIFVHAGTHMLGDPSMQMGVCEEVVVHPTFEMRNGTQTWDGIDLAIVKLTRNFTGSPSLQPIPKIENVTTSDDIKGTAVGWGALDETTHNFSVVLQQADMTVWNGKLCQEQFVTNNLTFNGENHFCAGGSGTNIGVGDQGGPFVIRDSNSNSIDENYVLLGVTLGSIETEDGKGPSIFISLASQLDWIQENVNLDIFTPETENQETSSENEDETKSDSTSTTTFTPSSSTTTPAPSTTGTETPYTSTEAPPPQSSTEEPTSSPTTTPSIDSSTSTSTLPSSTSSTSSSETPFSTNSTSSKPPKNNASAISYPIYTPLFLIHVAIVTILLS